MNRRLLCPVRGCDQFKEAWQAFCRSHWARLTDGQRKLIWDIYNIAKGSRTHLSIVLAARNALEEQDGR